jgi:hypothetical protein
MKRTKAEWQERIQQLEEKLAEANAGYDAADDSNDSTMTATATAAARTQQPPTIKRSEWEKMTGKESSAFFRTGGKIVDD